MTLQTPLRPGRANVAWSALRAVSKRCTLLAEAVVGPVPERMAAIIHIQLMSDGPEGALVAPERVVFRVGGADERHADALGDRLSAAVTDALVSTAEHHVLLPRGAVAIETRPATSNRAMCSPRWVEVTRRRFGPIPALVNDHVELPFVDGRLDLTQRIVRTEFDRMPSHVQLRVAADGRVILEATGTTYVNDERVREPVTLARRDRLRVPGRPELWLDERVGWGPSVTVVRR